MIKFRVDGHKDDDTTQQAAKFLGVIGVTVAEKGFEKATAQISLSLEAFGRTAAEKGFEDAKRQAAESLAELTILNEEIVKTAIQDYESKLEEQDRGFFQKFMKEYEQELEKLRAKKRTANVSQLLTANNPN